jgi:acyl-coenzyme A thioesterase PaaI-like protein
MLAALLDVAAAVRLLPELADGESAVTHAASCSVLRPVPEGTRLLLRADLLRKSGTRAYLRCSACVDEEAVAVGQVTKSLLGRAP